jgi:hypothetical protein
MKVQVYNKSQRTCSRNPRLFCARRWGEEVAEVYASVLRTVMVDALINILLLAVSAVAIFFLAYWLPL